MKFLTTCVTMLAPPSPSHVGVCTQDRLSPEQYLELLLGPKGEASAFDSEESRLAAWRTHAPGVVSMVDPGSRPWAWWHYDAPEPLGPRETELDYLARRGLLSEAEHQCLEREGIQIRSQATRKP